MEAYSSQNLDETGDFILISSDDDGDVRQRAEERRSATSDGDGDGGSKRVLQNPAVKLVDLKEYMEVAKKALNFLKENIYNPQSRRLQHSFKNGPSKAPGFLDDYAFLISRLLDVYEHGGEIS
ncbi:hypothetical protein L1987_23124 [Smallanthus sonchifolius]|uniref:Uncharacterized protein n=1 Tax=Smallanthus sonchifolius TaxID=185202 RepID=A0ACB9IGY0_9ASTR|nr:hypothetical protein L1987_23124 [Smallanthus sonchifolius]